MITKLSFKKSDFEMRSDVSKFIESVFIVKDDDHYYITETETEYNVEVEILGLVANGK